MFIFYVCQTLDDITYETPEYEGSEKEWHDIIGYVVFHYIIIVGILVCLLMRLIKICDWKLH